MSVNKVQLSNGEVLMDLTGDSVTPAAMVEGTTAHDAVGDLIRGTMPDRGTINASIDGMTITSYTIPAGKHSGSGKVSLTDDISNALAEVSGGSGLSIPGHIDRINDAVSDQKDLIAQVKAALNGKATNGGGSAPVIESLQVTQNGTYTAPSGVDGYSPVVVNVPVPDGYIKPSGTLQITKNGEHDVAAYAKVNVAVSSGGGGMVIKSGTTTSRTINTGLSNVEQFFMYKESQTGTGLIRLHYTKSATSRMYASAWSTNNYGTKTITNGTGGVTVSGGTVTISATQATQGALTSNVTYKWVAVGTE